MVEQWKYTAPQLAAELGVTLAAVWRAVALGNLPRRKLPMGSQGNRYRLVFTECDRRRYERLHLGRQGRPQKMPGN